MIIDGIFIFSHFLLSAAMQYGYNKKNQEDIYWQIEYKGMGWLKWNDT